MGERAFACSYGGGKGVYLQEGGCSKLVSTEVPNLGGCVFLWVHNVCQCEGLCVVIEAAVSVSLIVRACL